MTAHTSNYSFPYPELSDIPDGATETENLAVAVDTQLAVTDATVATNATHSTLLATLLGGATKKYVNSSATITSLVTGNTTYTGMIETTGSVKIGTSFVAPPSGAVTIEWGLNVRANTAGTTIHIGTSVSTGATVSGGTSVSPAVDAETLSPSGAASSQVEPESRSRDVTGLTPGSTYNTWIVWKNSGSGTADANGPYVSVTPILA